VEQRISERSRRPENETVVLILLRHRSHELQILDFTAFRLYNRNIILALVTGCCQNPIKHVTTHSVTSITAKSFSKTFTKHNIEHGFSVTRIHPLNRSILVLICHRQILQSGNNQTTMHLQTPRTKELPSVMTNVN
jgi:hypothetical protein